MAAVRRSWKRLALVVAAIVLVVPVVVAVLLVLVGGIFSHRSVQSSARELFERDMEGEASGVVTETDIAGLPEPVQRWLRSSNVVGNEPVRTMRLRQEGRFRQNEGGRWMDYEAVEFFSVDPPAFVWRASFNFAGVPFLEVRDSYREGKGETAVRLAFSIPVGTERGPEVDQGDLLRFLNETMWFPSAALSDYIEWEPVDANSARATMSYAGVTASAVFEFDGDGRLVNMSADRYGKFDGEFSMERWMTPLHEHAEFEGVRVPTKGTGVWALDSGDFSYIELEVTEINYNVSEGF